jgi:hypothetical protein
MIRWHLGYCNKRCTPVARGFDTFVGGFGDSAKYSRHKVAVQDEYYYDWQKNNKVDFSSRGTHSQVRLPLQNLI